MNSLVWLPFLLLAGGCTVPEPDHPPVSPPPAAVRAVPPLSATAAPRPSLRLRLERTLPDPAHRRDGANRPWTDPVSGITLAQVEGGCFTMGDDQGRPGEGPAHPVCLKSFWIGIHEVTQEQWQRVTRTLPLQVRPGGELPVSNVSWNDVQGFLLRLNAASPGRFRLPTEAEWEFACRNRGVARPYCGAHSDPATFAWHDGAWGGSQPVGRLTANELGLFDMNGNVWEWVSDWFGEDYYKHAPRRDPAGPETGISKVFRGGGWLSERTFLRASGRASLWPDRSYDLLGFRVAGTPARGEENGERPLPEHAPQPEPEGIRLQNDSTPL